MSFSKGYSSSLSALDLKLFQCPICLTMTSDLEKHWLENNPCVDILMIKMSKNGLNLAVLSSTRNSNERGHQSHTENLSRSSHKCHHCGKVFGSGEQLLDHYRTTGSCFMSHVNASRMHGYPTLVRFPSTHDDNNGKVQRKRKST